MHIRLLTFSLILFIIAAPASSVHADNFSTSVKTSYTYSPDYSCHLSQSFSIKNLTSRILASNYEYRIHGPIPANLSAADSRGPLVIQTEKLPAGDTLIRVLFNNVAAGRDKTLDFSISQDCPPAENNSGVYSVFIPRLADPETINELTLNVSVPGSFGNPLHLYPQPVGITHDPKNSFTTYTFTKSQFTQSGLNAAFGNFYTVEFSLRYTLPNFSGQPVSASLILPSDSPQQKVIINSIVPQALRVRTGQNDTWIADFQAAPRQTFQASVHGFARLTMNEELSGTPSAQTLRKYFTIPTVDSSILAPQDILVAPGSYQEPRPLSPSYKIIPPGQVLPFRSSVFTLQITNPGEQGIHDLKIHLAASGITLGIQDLVISDIPPFGQVDIIIPAELRFTDLFTGKFVTISGEKPITYNISGSVFLFTYGLITTLISIIILAAATLTHRSWSLHIQKPRR